MLKTSWVRKLHVGLRYRNSSKKLMNWPLKIKTVGFKRLRYLICKAIIHQILAAYTFRMDHKRDA